MRTCSWRWDLLPEGELHFLDKLVFFPERRSFNRKGNRRHCLLGCCWAVSFFLPRSFPLALRPSAPERSPRTTAGCGGPNSGQRVQHERTNEQEARRYGHWPQEIDAALVRSKKEKTKDRRPGHKNDHRQDWWTIEIFNICFFFFSQTILENK